jgi:hypothetical protein
MNIRITPAARITTLQTPRRFPKWLRNLLIVIATPFMLAFLMGAGVGLYQAATSDTPKVDRVAVFNDGFADSKQDDCQQGFQAACDWIAAR